MSLGVGSNEKLLLIADAAIMISGTADSLVWTDSWDYGLLGVFYDIV